VNRRIPLMTYYIIGGIALICVFFIQLAGKLTNATTVEENKTKNSGLFFAKN